MIGTGQQISRTKTEWERIAGESLEVEQVSGALYAFGSELATLRLLAKYRSIDAANVGYSASLDTHYFILDLSCA